MSSYVGEQCEGSARLAVLVVALESGLSRRRAESALVILGSRAQALDLAIASGLLREGGGRLEVTDVLLTRRIIQAASDCERTLGHLALACSAAPKPQALFDRLGGWFTPVAWVPVMSGAVDTRDGGHVAPTEGTEREPDDVLRARPATSAPDALTPRERNVALLAATGAPTTEIASATFLSPRTVEHHLTQIYRKLGVRSKAELACLLRLA
ncbi:MAG: helix-turn-helix transcriptional regulator [Nocardioides sp.]